jgi:hypothetical protein
MKSLFMVLCLLSRWAIAVEVEAVGHGSTAEEALNNAKTVAIEQVVGTFVTGRSEVENGNYRQRIDQYHGGRILHYELLSNEIDNGLIVTRIRADVDTAKVNEVAVGLGADISPTTVDQLSADRDDAKRARKILDALDDPAQAYVFRLQKITYRNRGDEVDVTLEGGIYLNPKWVDDLKILAQTMNRPVDLGSSWSDFFWGVSALSAVLNPALPGTISHLARATQTKPSTGETYMACFGETPGWDVDECHLILHPLYRLSRNGRRNLHVMMDNGSASRLVGQIPINIDALLPEVNSGQKAYFTKSARERRFGFPGVLVYGKIAMPFRYTLAVPLETVQEGKSFLLSLEGKS